MKNHYIRLMHCLAGSIAAGNRSAARLELVSTILRNWNSDLAPLLPLLAGHGLTGSAYDLLEREVFDQIEAARQLKALLQRPMLQETALTLAHLRTLDRASNVLEPEGIELIVTQGTALLAHQIYPRVDLRPMADADAVVRADQWERAIAILAAAGFEAGDTRSQWLDGAGVLDLHPAPLGMDRISARTLAVPLTTDLVREHSGTLPAGSPIDGNMLVPDLPMQWAMGLAHVQKHSFNGLVWLVDLALLAEVMTAEEHRKARLLSDRLRLQGAGAVVNGILRSRWDIPLPQELSFSLEGLDRKMRRLVERATDQISSLDVQVPLGEHMLWRMVPGRLDRLRLVVESAYPRADVMREIYLGYVPWMRPWFMLRRSWDLGRRYLRNR